MPSIHIQDKIWEQVKEQHVDAIVKTKVGFKETEILHLLLEIGLKNVTDEDLLREAMKKNGKWRLLK